MIKHLPDRLVLVGHLLDGQLRLFEPAFDLLDFHNDFFQLVHHQSFRVIQLLLAFALLLRLLNLFLRLNEQVTEVVDRSKVVL